MELKRVEISTAALIALTRRASRPFTIEFDQFASAKSASESPGIAQGTIYSRTKPGLRRTWVALRRQTPAPNIQLMRSRNTTLPGFKRGLSRGRAPARSPLLIRARQAPQPARITPPLGLSEFRWAETISRSEWSVYLDAINALRQAGVPFLLGGGFALATFTGRWRDTKDIDFYIMPQAREAAVAALVQAGFTDYFKRVPYDRKWIHRSVRSDVIVDLIWAMANQRARVDEQWFHRANTTVLRGEPLQVVPMEEFIWCKLYILQRDHCDWTDLFNLFHTHIGRIDWGHLIARLDEDAPLLKAALSVFGWLRPERMHELAPSLHARLDAAIERWKVKRPMRNRVRLLDTRAWFAALQPPHKKMEV